MHRFCRGISLLALLAVNTALAPPAHANHLDELILFDQTGAAKKLDEGLVRQRLGLLNADGRPTLPLVALVSADGKRAAYDMSGNYSFDGLLNELKNDAGVLTIITHANIGVIEIMRHLVDGFGTGTGATYSCPLTNAEAVHATRTHVVVNLAACHAGASNGPVRSVSSSLSDAIVAAGGSVSIMRASFYEVPVNARLQVRIRDGYTPTEAEITAVQAAFGAFVIDGRAFANQYSDFQAALDGAAPPDVNGSKIIARISYSAVIDDFTLNRAGFPRLSSATGSPRTTGLETLVKDVSESGCDCHPLAIPLPQSTPFGLGALAVTLLLWGGMKVRRKSA